MSKIFLFSFILFGFSSCVVSKKKYDALEQELSQIKSDLQDDDKDGVPNYVDIEPNTEALAKVDTKGRTIIVEKIVDLDGDGVLDVDDFCPTIKGIASANGCPDKDGDGINDFEDKCPNETGSLIDGGCPFIEINDKLKKNGGYAETKIVFKGKSLDFTEQTILIIDGKLCEIVETMNDSLNYKLRIEGHTDNSGIEDDNIKLAKKRAEKIRDLLIKEGISKNRISIESMGSESPCFPNGTRQGKIINNRVELRFQSF